MPGSSDTLFIEMAVAKGYLDRAHGEEALNIQTATAGDGASRRPLRDVLVESGWMTKEQVSEISGQMEEGAAKTGRIEGYKLLSKIARGGMGAVYKAEREATGETVALKILPRRMAQKPGFVERFLRESRAASKIRSAYIVRTIDVGFSGGYYYFAMEYVQGESVDTTLSIDSSIAESKALRIVHHIALALRHAGAAGMVHRDIKPGNILVGKDGVARLADFGLARDIQDDSVAQTGVTLGTPNYMSPEQARGVKPLDVRSDIYSLGVTFYYMVTGALPFQAETSLLTMLKHLNEQPVAPITRRSDLSRGCNAVILKMLAKDRDKRYQDASQLSTDIELVMEGKQPKFAETTEPKPEKAAEEAPVNRAEPAHSAEGTHKRGHGRWLSVGIALLLIALVGTMVYVLFFQVTK